MTQTDERLEKYGENLHSRDCEKGYQKAKEMGINRVAHRVIIFEMISKKGYKNGQIEDYAKLYQISVNDAHGELIFFYRHCDRDENNNFPIIDCDCFSLGDDKARCSVSFFIGDAGSVLMQIRHIKGIAVKDHDIFPDVHPKELDIPIPLPDHIKLSWHTKDGIQAVKLTGTPVPTFIPCTGYELEDFCLLLGKGYPNCSA